MLRRTITERRGYLKVRRTLNESITSVRRALAEAPVKNLEGTETEKNLKATLSDEGSDRAKYLYCARSADAEGMPEVAALFSEVAAEEAAHADGTLRFLTGIKVGKTEFNLRTSAKGETVASTKVYPGFAKVAEDEGFPEIAEWFRTIAKTEGLHAEWYQDALDNLGEPPLDVAMGPEEETD